MTQSNMSIAARDRLQNVSRRADAHEIARPILGQDRLDLLDHRQHHRLRFADRQAADRVAVKADLDQPASAGAAQLGHIAALDDAEQHVCPAARSRRRACCAPPSATTAASRVRYRRGSAGSRTHSSSCIAMSEPSSRCTSIERSGDSSTLAPSICERKVTALFARPCAAPPATSPESRRNRSASVRSSR